MKIEKTKKRNLAIPGEPMYQEEFVSLIKDAEKGAFYTEDEFRKNLGNGNYCKRSSPFILFFQ